MKIFFVLCGILAMQACNQSASGQKAGNGTPAGYPETAAAMAHEKGTGDTVLNNIQEKIGKASNDGFAKRNTQKLDEVESLLEGDKAGNANLKNYWSAYINYYKTIIATQLKDKALGSMSNKKGIEFLEKNPNKSSDDYALLALLKGMSYAFVSGMEAPAISKDINKLIKKGIEADSKNFRIYYAQGSIDFYTPKEFGGGTKVKNALLKAIGLPEKNGADPQLPTWGKEEAYDLMIRFCLREGQKGEAKKYFDSAKQLFPNSEMIRVYQSKF